MEQIELDEKDLLILKALNSGALYASLKAIVEMTGLNKQLVYSRVNKMFENGTIKDYVTRLSYHKIGLTVENVTFYRLDMQKTHEMGYGQVMEIINNNPHVVRLKSLVPTTNYHLFVNEVFKDANDSQEHMLDMHKRHPKLMELIKEKLVFTLNNEDPHMNKPFNINVVLDAIAQTKGYSLELTRTEENNKIRISK